MLDDKPGVSSTPQPADTGVNAANGTTETPANQSLMETLSDDQKAYLKGIGIENLDASNFGKVIDTAIKQKTSVSKSSKEIAELKAMLSSQGNTTNEQTTAPQEEFNTQPENSNYSEDRTPTQQPSAVGQSNGVTQNDLFDLSMMIQNNFPELVHDASTGALFDDLRIHGFFGINGIDKKSTYEYLTQKNAQAKELRELREFKKQITQGDATSSVQYVPTAGYKRSNEVTDMESAKNIIIRNMSGEDIDRAILNKAREILQQGALKDHPIR